MPSVNESCPKADPGKTVKYPTGHDAEKPTPDSGGFTFNRDNIKFSKGNK